MFSNPGLATTLRVATGFFVGEFVGILVGLDVGFLLGLLVGFTVGLVVGLLVGLVVGLLVGLVVGFEVGDDVGLGVPVPGMTQAVSEKSTQDLPASRMALVQHCDPPPGSWPHPLPPHLPQEEGQQTRVPGMPFMQ